jgi:hypothetical protein
MTDYRWGGRYAPPAARSSTKRDSFGTYLPKSNRKKDDGIGKDLFPPEDCIEGSKRETSIKPLPQGRN